MGPRLFILATLLAGLGLAGDDWGPLQFLVGNWTGDGSGQPGQGTGAFSFTPDLQGKVLVRKNFAEYPAQNGKEASRHDDLMIVYRENEQLKADYFDSEAHVIRYEVKTAAGAAVFESAAQADLPRFRLSYTSTGVDRLKLKFEIAPPGKNFAPYIDATAHRVAAAKR